MLLTRFAFWLALPSPLTSRAASSAIVCRSKRGTVREHDSHRAETTSSMIGRITISGTGIVER